MENAVGCTGAIAEKRKVFWSVLCCTEDQKAAAAIGLTGTEKSLPIVLTPPTTAPDQADGVPLEFCGRYSLDDNCAWGIEVTTDFWIYPNGYVYYRAECEEGVMIQHGTVMFEGSEIWDGTIVWTMKIKYHHREFDYFNTCTHWSAPSLCTNQ